MAIIVTGRISFQPGKQGSSGIGQSKPKVDSMRERSVFGMVLLGNGTESSLLSQQDLKDRANFYSGSARADTREGEICL